MTILNYITTQISKNFIPCINTHHGLQMNEQSLLKNEVSFLGIFIHKKCLSIVRPTVDQLSTNCGTTVNEEKTNMHIFASDLLCIIKISFRMSCANKHHFGSDFASNDKCNTRRDATQQQLTYLYQANTYTIFKYYNSFENKIALSNTAKGKFLCNIFKLMFVIETCSCIQFSCDWKALL